MFKHDSRSTSHRSDSFLGIDGIRVALKLIRFRGHFLTYVEGVHYGQQAQGLPYGVPA